MGSLFDISMVLRHQDVQILALPDGNGVFIRFTGVECRQHDRVGTTFIDGDDLWFTVMANGLAEKAQSCCYIAA